jgi:hypothetical protein
MGQVAVIQRHLFAPLSLPRAQYLARETTAPMEDDWCEKRAGAFEFASHALADDFAAQLRAAGIEHVHAVVSEKPAAHRGVTIADCGIEDFTAARSNDREARESASMIESSTRAPVRDSARAGNSRPTSSSKFWYREGQFA